MKHNDNGTQRRARLMVSRLCALFFCAAMALTTAAAREPEMKTVYMFGFAASFTDSVAYQTVVQQIDSAWLDAHKMLIDRSLYSLQLQYYVESSEGKSNSTCTVFFSTSRRRIDRTWKKVRKRFEHAEGLHLTTLPTERFAFKAEEYRPIIIEEGAPAQPTAGQTLRQSAAETLVNFGVEAVKEGVKTGLDKGAQAIKKKLEKNR